MLKLPQGTAYRILAQFHDCTHDDNSEQRAVNKSKNSRV